MNPSVSRYTDPARHYSLSRYAPWRRRPASEKALGMLLKIKGLAAEGDNGAEEGGRKVNLFGKTVNVEALTAGEVSSFL